MDRSLLMNDRVLVPEFAVFDTYGSFGVRTHSAPTFAKEQPTVFGIGSAEASRFVPCFMPKAWRRGCEASAVKVAAR
jgi:hypothetical protein